MWNLETLHKLKIVLLKGKVTEVVEPCPELGDDGPTPNLSVGSRHFQRHASRDEEVIPVPVSSTSAEITFSALRSV